MKKLRRSYFTLLETLIAIAWTTILLSSLFFFYGQISVMGKQAEAIQMQSFQMRLVESRLASTLTQTLSVKAKEDFFFFTSNAVGEGESLVFSFDNKADLDKEFSNNALGRLYLANGNLCLATWPSPSRWIEGVPPAVKNEILVTQVSRLAFSFFVPPDKKWRLDDVSEEAPASSSTQRSAHPKPEPTGEWKSEWSQGYRLLPGLVKIEIELAGSGHKMEKAIYIFPLANTERPIVYNE